jgi:hypothetical protein
MQYNDTARRDSVQPEDFLEAMLFAGRAPRLQELLALEWPSPASRPVDDLILLPQILTPRELARCRADFARLEFRYSGVIIDWHAAEEAKYGVRWPDEGAPLSEIVGRYLLHIRGKWSRVVLGAGRAPQFNDYIGEYVGGENVPGYCGRCYHRGGGYDLAPQILRLACGLPRFLPTREAR